MACGCCASSVNTKPAAARKPTTAIEMDILAGLATRTMPQSYASASQASSRVLLWRADASDPLREPVLNGREIDRHESLQRRSLSVASDLRFELSVIRLWQDAQRVVAVAGRFEGRLPGSFVLVGHDVVVELPEDGQHWHLQPTKRRARIVEVDLPDELPVRIVPRSRDRGRRRS